MAATTSIHNRSLAPGRRRRTSTFAENTLANHAVSPIIPEKCMQSLIHAFWFRPSAPKTVRVIAFCGLFWQARFEWLSPSRLPLSMKKCVCALLSSQPWIQRRSSRLLTVYAASPDIRRFSTLGDHFSRTPMTISCWSLPWRRARCSSSLIISRISEVLRHLASEPSLQSKP